MFCRYHRNVSDVSWMERILTDIAGAHLLLLGQKVRHSLQPLHTSVESTPLATGFSKAFPGIKPHLLTLTTNFQMPFYRDLLLGMGICSVSKKSCTNILRSGPGNSITIVVGGAAESLNAHPGTADLTLRKRCVEPSAN